MAHSFVFTYSHFVWATRERLPLITADNETELYDMIVRIARDIGCWVCAVGGMPDHVHLLVQIPATVSVAEIAKKVKGGSSRHLSVLLGREIWLGWQGSYGALSVSPRDVKAVERYIQGQKKHHLDGERLWPWAERTELVEDEQDNISESWSEPSNSLDKE